MWGDLLCFCLRKSKQTWCGIALQAIRRFQKGTPTEGWHLGTKHPSLETPESVAKTISSSMELRASLLSDWVGLEGDPIDV